RWGRFLLPLWPCRCAGALGHSARLLWRRSRLHAKERRGRRASMSIVVELEEEPALRFPCEGLRGPDSERSGRGDFEWEAATCFAARQRLEPVEQTLKGRGARVGLGRTDADDSRALWRTRSGLSAP